jgi:hypothetical protein
MTHHIEGLVTRERWAVGSKSESEAVCVHSGGQRYRLRREGGNAFIDTELDALVGKTIRGEGRPLAGSTFLLSDWDILDAA